jgi:hypothetical protein
MGLLHKLSSIWRKNLEASIEIQTVSGSISPDTQQKRQGNRFPDGVYHNAPSNYPDHFGGLGGGHLFKTNPTFKLIETVSGAAHFLLVLAAFQRYL